MPDFQDLPYAENGGYAPKSFRIFTIALTAAMAASNGLSHFLRFLPTFSWTDVFTPIAVLGALLLLHRCVRNASHEAIRLASADEALDRMVMENVGRHAKRTLTPLSLSKHLDETLP